MIIVETVQDLRAARNELTGKIGLVPTMGYLHAGHLSLVEMARSDCDKVIATIFVNPTQFGVNEDLSTYPRNLPHDLAMLESAGVDLVFTPTPQIMYPPQFQTWVTVEDVARGREGGTRPKHFRGVSTIVSKLFNLTQPDYAYFGQKDAQQVVVIRQLIRDLNFPIHVHVGAIIRESDGLALSSRNVYLKEDERKAAICLYSALLAVGDLYAQGERNPNQLRKVAENVIGSESLAQLDYVSIARARTFIEIDEPTDEPLLLSVAAQVGKPRLLDNCLLPLELNTSKGVTALLGVEG